VKDDTSALAEFFKTIVLIILAFLLGGILVRLDRLLTLLERSAVIEQAVADITPSTDITDITPPMLTEEGSRLLWLLRSSPDDSGASGDTGS
jgi:hypothetical protein